MNSPDSNASSTHPLAELRRGEAAVVAGLAEVAGFDDGHGSGAVCWPACAISASSPVRAAKSSRRCGRWATRMVVRVGGSTFALRRAEAAAVQRDAPGTRTRGAGCAGAQEHQRRARLSAGPSRPSMDAVVSTPSLRIALIGVPNCGKTALFNRLTGSRQKVANYPGVTVERREGERAALDGRVLRILDLPGTYSLSPTTLDEAITRDVLLGRVARCAGARTRGVRGRRGASADRPAARARSEAPRTCPWCWRSTAWMSPRGAACT